ncbi:MAG: hypothetical protein JZU52_03465 [Lamprocystis purpurea]|jgi:hypothetical protein|uniref:hypothetical protein n=1 Tax=Lamprocystis purpurea TaxID=61598 RepID=UPI00035D8F30|nr:hypothetical protein [Lamprocystis purpurea]MBV5272726.1 hypothetical protein [Lamprocystis purpurea]
MKNTALQSLLAGLATLSLVLGSGEAAAATVTITEAPPCGGGASQTAPISGTSAGAESGDRIVLWAIAEQTAYVQPFVASPFTAIAPDGSWRNFSHLGANYVAMLVRHGYQPPATAFAPKLPKVGGDIVAMDMVQCGGR